MRPLLAGHIMVDLHCIILHRSQPLVMCVRATSQVSHTVAILPPSICSELFSVHRGLGLKQYGIVDHV